MSVATFLINIGGNQVSLSVLETELYRLVLSFTKLASDIMVMGISMLY